VSYAAAQDMIDRFGEREVIMLTDREELGVIGEAVLAHALSHADGLINGYLRARYPLPLTAHYPILTTFAVDIARYLLLGAEANETSPARDRYKNAIRFLELIAEGKIGLGADTDGQSGPASSRIGVVGGHRVFTGHSLAEYLERPC
jgi:phage gp36-like protein